eukprot:TRINITY_DN3842_c0_g1_i19.p1 TRINITY_DN3842_c0_g1~~TRINITY_DN3842_c0_g1_i19.p1  ORF type:complete len:359 (+),score=124.92 TRINITY_DN3842_c0_g1_i19:981-2057(+)
MIFEAMKQNFSILASELKLKSTVGEVSTSELTVDTTNSSLEAQCLALTRENQSLKEQLEHSNQLHEQELQGLRQEKGNITKEMEIFKKEHDVALQTKSELKTQYQTLQEEKDTIKRDLMLKSIELQDLKTKLQGTLETLHSCKQQSDVFQQEANEKELHVSSVEEELRMKKEELASVLSKFDLVNKKLQQQIERSELMEQQHVEKLKTLQSSIQKCEADKKQKEDEFKGILMRFKEALDVKQGEVEKEKQTNSHLKDQIHEKDQKIFQLSGLVSVELEKEKQKGVEMSKLLEEKENLFRSLQEELEKEKRKISQLEKTVEEKDAKILQLSRTVQVIYGTMRTFQQQAQNSVPTKGDEA